MLRLLLALILLLSAAPSGAQDLHSMVVGDKIIELASNRHVVSLPDSKITGAWISPNAKYLAFTSQDYWGTDDKVQDLFCTRVNETKSYKLLTSSPIPENPAPGTEVWRLTIIPFSNTPVVSWSPDNGLIAFAAEKHIIHADYISTGEQVIKVFTPSGMERASFDVGGFGDISSRVIWSPDCRSFAVLFVNPSIVDHSVKPDDKPDHRIVVFNLSSGKVETVYTQEGSPLVLEGWSSDGESVIYATAEDIAARSKTAKHTFWSAVDYLLPYLTRDRSPDGKWWVAHPDQGIKLTNDADGSTIDAIKAPAPFSCWAPNSRMYAYIRSVVVADDSNLRVRNLDTLWLGTIGKYKLNCMCVSFDSSLFAEPTWSADSTSMAYVCGGGAYLAQFSSREPTLREKVNGGIALSDEEYKTLVTENAKNIGTAFLMYPCDWDDQLPPKDQVAEKLNRYLQYSDTFLKPGTDDYIFQYECDLPESKIDDPSTTVRAYLDAAPDWRVAIYADGHTEIVPY